MPARLLPRSEVIDRLAAVFRRHGYDGATLSRMSEATGLGKASLYHHFPGGKAEMAQTVLDQAEAWLRSELLAPLRQAGAPRDRLAAMCRALERRHAGGREASLLASLSLGEREAFQDRLRRAFRLWIGALAETLAEAGIARAEAARRAEDAVARIQGALILAAGLGSPAPFRTLMKELPDALLAGASGPARRPRTGRRRG